MSPIGKLCSSPKILVVFLLLKTLNCFLILLYTIYGSLHYDLLAIKASKSEGFLRTRKDAMVSLTCQLDCCVICEISFDTL